jgi:SAM-dependent methyltransferase
MHTKRDCEWFDKWFDSPYYHILYKNRNEGEAELFIDNLLAKIDLPANARAVDIACGKGRHAIYLNKKGFDVTGIDISAESIKHAKQYETDTLHFFVHDMRRPFVTNYFDLAVNLFTSFGYFKTERENELAIKTMSLALKKNGILVIDFFNAELTLKKLIPAEEKTVDKIKFNIKKKLLNKTIIKEIDFDDSNKHCHFTEKVQALTLTDFERYFKAAGLKIINLFGDYSLNPYKPAESERLIIVAIK